MKRADVRVVVADALVVAGRRHREADAFLGARLPATDLRGYGQGETAPPSRIATPRVVAPVGAALQKLVDQIPVRAVDLDDTVEPRPLGMKRGLRELGDQSRHTSASDGTQGVS